MREPTVTTRNANARRGQTLIELVIVITILALLMSLVAGAVFRVRESQEQRFTEATLQKLGSLLEQHWRVTIDTARKQYDTLPKEIKQNLIKLADNPPSPGIPPQARRDDRARLIYVKFLLQQEFPTSFAKAFDPAAASTPVAGQTFLVPSQGVGGNRTGKAAYR